MKDKGKTPVKVEVADDSTPTNKESYYFNVDVYNEPPILLGDPPTDVYFDFKKE